MKTIRNKFRLAVVGAGGVGSIHIRNALASDKIELVGVCELDEVKARSCIGSHEVPIEKRIEGLMQYQPDGIVVSSSTSSHGSVCKQIIELKLPFLCEKPIASDYVEAKNIQEYASSENVYGAMAFNRRFHARYKQMRSSIEKGDIGTPETLHVVSRTANPPSAKFITTSGGLFGEKGSHFYDLIRWIFKTNVKEVFTFGDALFDPEFKKISQPDTAAICMRLDNGILCTFDFSWHSAYGQDERMEIFGSEGMLKSIQDTDGAIQHYGKDGYYRAGQFPGWQSMFYLTYIDELHAFVSEVEHDNVRTMPSLADGVEVQRVAQAIERSYSEKRQVAVSEID